MSPLMASLPPDPASPSRARRSVGDHLRANGLGALVEIAELLVSELVTNAVLHARSMVRLEMVAVRKERIRVSVCDESPLQPAPHRPFTDDAATGRGTMLLDALAADWGWRTAEGGKCVWMELDTNDMAA